MSDDKTLDRLKAAVARPATQGPSPFDPRKLRLRAVRKEDKR